MAALLPEAEWVLLKTRLGELANRDLGFLWVGSLGLFVASSGLAGGFFAAQAVSESPKPSLLWLSTYVAALLFGIFLGLVCSASLVRDLLRWSLSRFSIAILVLAACSAGLLAWLRLAA